jgi:UDP-N-acetylglucosamine--N-acetylmuramyl-(pentapeptide) pyrophosphoryl-undecaprenol N-acetylglucosamine transferase
VAEAWANRVPTVFMPYPYHKDQHQKKNAEPLVAVGGAVLCEDRIDPRRNIDEAGPVVMGLAADPVKRAAMKAALDKLGPADGAKRVALKLMCP